MSKNKKKKSVEINKNRIIKIIDKLTSTEQLVEARPYYADTLYRAS